MAGAPIAVERRAGRGRASNRSGTGDRSGLQSHIMDVYKRSEALADYAVGPSKIKDFIGKIPKEAIDYRPFEDAWTIAEHTHHLLDAEMNGYVRYRNAIAEPGSLVRLWDQEGWKAKLGYAEQDLSSSLEAFALIRSIVHRHLSRIVSEDWSKYTFVHPERGTVDLDGWLETYLGHVKTHLDYFERNLRLFKEKG